VPALTDWFTPHSAIGWLTISQTAWGQGATPSGVEGWNLWWGKSKASLKTTVWWRSVTEVEQFTYLGANVASNFARIFLISRPAAVRSQTEGRAFARSALSSWIHYFIQCFRRLRSPTPASIISGDYWRQEHEQKALNNLFIAFRFFFFVNGRQDGNYGGFMDDETPQN